jgi:hypothetical protein
MATLVVPQCALNALSEKNEGFLWRLFAATAIRAGSP